MFQVYTLNKISKEGLATFDSSVCKIIDENNNPDAIIVRSAAMHDMTFNPNLLAIARAGAGVNNIPVDRCSDEGIVVFNTPGANANAVKELVLAGLFLSSRKIVDGIIWAKTLDGTTDDVAKAVEKGKGAFVGPEIAGKKLGIIGLGAIGVMVANAAHHLDMDVYGYDPYISVDAAWGLSRAVKKSTNMKEIFENCDYITVHVPLNNETRGMLNNDAFANMKDGVRILNYSRAELANCEDMAAALESGKVACYVTDFPNEATMKMKNIITIPHLGASTPESEENCAIMASVELAEFLQTGNILNSVNFPNAEMPLSGDNRICIIHKNIPNMLSQISSIVSDGGTNIANMMNKSKKENAYTIIDIEGNVNASVIEKLKAVNGVLRIRVI